MNPTLSDISNIMKMESPVFIVGAPRSGSSIFYKSLQYHSSFKLSKPGVELTETKVFESPYEAYDIFKNTSLAYMLDDKVYYQQFLDSTSSIQKYQKSISYVRRIFKKVANKSNISRSFLWRILLNDRLVQSFFYYAKQARGVKRIIEKTPTHIFHLTEIKTTFPYAKLLFIYRHPVDVFSSYKRREQVEKELGSNEKGLAWLRITPEAFCDNYARYIRVAQREHISNPSGFMSIKYEDFTKDSQAIFTRICEFIGEPYEEELMFNKNQESDWKQDPYLFKGITEKTKNWKDFISEADARFIEDRLDKIMCQLDYPRYA
jgi:hypothetical protein